MAYFALGKFEPGRVFFGLNLGLKRYERCPHCRKWHMISVRDSVKDGEASDV